MNKDEYNFTMVSKEYLTISIEPDIHLSDNEQIHLNKCFSHLLDIFSFSSRREESSKNKLFVCLIVCPHFSDWSKN